MFLTQAEFEYLMKLKKVFNDDTEITLGSHFWSRDIISVESKDTFILDFHRGKIEFKKYTYNKRFKTSIVLLRYDSSGRHSNPPGTDGNSFNGPHVHIYKEGYFDKWAFPIDKISIVNKDDIGEVTKKLLDFCNIIDCPEIKIPLI